MGQGVSMARIDSAGRSIALAIFLITASFVLVKTGRDALYVQERGIFDLPLAYLGMAILSLPVAFGMLGLIRVVGPRRARIVAIGGVAAVLAVFGRFAEPGGGARMTVFFVAVPLLYGILFAGSWLLAAELFQGQSEERVSRAYARIGAGSIAGGVAGGVGARALAPVNPPEAFFWIGALVLGAGAMALAITQASYPPRAPVGGVIERPRLSSARAFLGQRYGALLLGVAVVGAVVGVLVEFQFYWAASASGAGGREQSRYFANLYLLLNAAALVVQLVVMPRVQRWLGVGGSLAVLPAMLLGGAVMVWLSAGLAARGALRVTEGGLKASIHRANWEQVFLPMGPDRAVAKLVVDGMGSNLGAGLIAAPLYLWLRFVVGSDPLAEHSGAWMAWLLIASTAAALGLTRMLSAGLPGGGTVCPSSGLSSLPHEGCVVTATLGQIVQNAECARRYGPNAGEADR